MSKDPTHGARGLLCPAGHYCLQGTYHPRATSAMAGQGHSLPVLCWWEEDLHVLNPASSPGHRGPK